MQIDNILSEKKLTVINITIVVYFIAIWLIYIYQIDFKIIGVIAELFTVPYLIGQVAFTVLSLWYLKRHNTTLLFKVSTVALIICSIITMASFF